MSPFPPFCIWLYFDGPLNIPTISVAHPAKFLKNSYIRFGNMETCLVDQSDPRKFSLSYSEPVKQKSF